MDEDKKIRKAPAFMFYADDFLAGTLEMSQEEVGQYIRLLCHQWNRGSIPVETERCDALEENERLRGALRTINSFIPKTKEITAFPHWVAIAGDIAEGALNGTWPAYRVMPAPAKEKE